MELFQLIIKLLLQLAEFIIGSTIGLIEMAVSIATGFDNFLSNLVK